ncbi:DUF3263 domain-containing protein [Streptomyces sp. JL1001]|uniref:DUF3263 domain-containing protein n=1 Tax=Streptomyces sp. JL1001 TaxID=3078227 RepID=A0AAU8KGH4_9ACTN|nr:DUF3263 domain-containing protein [Streptomyces sp. Termitarium-T10T-6]SCE55004.1 Protein of unknown function [Streptomyces sp. Termitarium-T10T-6]
MTAPDHDHDDAPTAPDHDHDDAPTAPAPGADELSVRDRALLALERRPWPGPGAKERAIREELGISPVRYYQLLNALIEDERALREDAVTVNRLRRVRDARRGRR